MSSDKRHNLWSVSTRERVRTRPLSQDLAVDLAIIGGGFTGTAAALEAARHGATVALFEAGCIGHGGSGRNVGLVNAGLWLPPDRIVQQLGEAAGTRLIRELAEAPQRVFELIEHEGIDCEATRAGTLHLAHARSGLRELQRRLEQGVRFGAPLTLLDAEETARRTGSTRYHGALFDPRAGTIQPLAYCHGLARAAQQAGARLYEYAPVHALSHHATHWQLQVHGYTIRTDALLVATNAYVQALDAGPLLARFARVHFSQFATRPLTPAQRETILAGGEGCWDTATVMSSLRLDQAGRLIVGGMGNESGAGGAIHAHWARRQLRWLYPSLGPLRFVYRWEGRIAMSANHIPKLQHLGPRGYALGGYSGRGIGPGTLFGTLAARALLQEQPERLPLPLQTPQNTPFTTTRSIVYELGATALHAVQPMPLLHPSKSTEHERFSPS